MTIYKDVPQPHIEITEEDHDERRDYGIRVCENNENATLQFCIDRHSKHEERKRGLPYMSVSFNKENTKLLYELLKQVYG